MEKGDVISYRDSCIVPESCADILTEYYVQAKSTQFYQYGLLDLHTALHEL